MKMNITQQSSFILITNFDLPYEDEAQFLSTFVTQDDRIVFPYLEPNFKNAKNTWKTFVLDRTLFTSEQWSNYWNMNINVHWYSPNCFDELVKIIERDPICFTCYVFPKNHNHNIQNFKYYISIDEHMGDRENVELSRGIYLEEREKGSFLSDIYPILKNVLILILEMIYSKSVNQNKGMEERNPLTFKESNF